MQLSIWWPCLLQNVQTCWAHSDFLPGQFLMRCSGEPHEKHVLLCVDVPVAPIAPAPGAWQELSGVMVIFATEWVPCPILPFTVLEVCIFSSSTRLFLISLTSFSSFCWFLTWGTDSVTLLFRPSWKASTSTAIQKTIVRDMDEEPGLVT